jgi:hypothetical protein
MIKNHPTIGCGGIGCGLCPRFYTDGKSGCPGCGGEDFEKKHPPCSFKTCCMKKHGLEACGFCADYPCNKYDNREKIEKDSFVTHKHIFQNHETIKADGIDRFLSFQAERISILEAMLAGFDDGRSKSYFCLAAALLQIMQIRSSIDKAAGEKDKKSKAKALKSLLQEHADSSGIRLSLDK